MSEDYIFNLANIEQAAIWLLNKTGNQPLVILFDAPMGTGKTTFISALCEVLGVKNAVSSPTFAIINEYQAAEGKTIFHIDAYRLKNENEAINAGIEDCLYSNDYCFVEWPGLIAGILPPGSLHIELEMVANNERKLSIKR